MFASLPIIWQVIALVTVVLIAVIYWRYFDSDARRNRAFLVELAHRDSVSDEQLFQDYFTSEETLPQTPGNVRSVFAAHMTYPADKLLPDDDLLFYWCELDMIHLIRDLEKEFDIRISKTDVETTAGCTIRAVTHLITRLQKSPSKL